MEYRGLYFNLFKGSMKKVIAQHYGKEYAREIMRKAKPAYRKLVEEADEIGPDSPMAYNELFALAFVAPYVASEKKIAPEVVQEMMSAALAHVSWYFRMTDVNTPKGKAANKKACVAQAAWLTPEREAAYPTAFKVDFEGQPYEGACYYRITRCPICLYLDKLGMSEIMGPLCDLDAEMIAYQHGVLHREHTIARGGAYCDYLIVGDKEEMGDRLRPQAVPSGD